MGKFAAVLLALAGACGSFWGVHAHAAESLPRDESAVHAWLEERHSGLYREMLARYDVATRAAPDDAALALARCRLMSAYTDEEFAWLQEAYDALAPCVDDVATRFPDVPEVQLYAFREDWSDDALVRGEALIADSSGWKEDTRRALHAELASRYRIEGDEKRANELAVVAARLGDPISVPAAARQLIAAGDQAGATALLLETPLPEYDGSLGPRIDAALLLDDPAVAQALLQQVEPAHLGLVGAARARVLLRAGDGAGALAAAETAHGLDEDLRRLRFDAAMLAGRHDAAAEQVAMQDTDAFDQNMERFARLMHAAPAALAHPPMALALLVFVVVLTAIFVLPGFLLVPVHYRGLAGRLRGHTRTPLFTWAGLRGAWLGLATLLIAPMLAAVLFVPEGVASFFGSEGKPNATALTHTMLLGVVIALVALSPYLLRAMRDMRGTMSIWRQMGFVALALVPLYAAAAIQGGWNAWRQADMDTAQAQAVEVLINGGAAGGPLLAMLLVVVLGPLLEELVFRGLLLGGMSRHIGFGWANTLQALLFAIIHFDPPRFTFYLMLGLLGGYLVRRTNSLLPAIALHMIANGIAFAVLAR